MKRKERNKSKEKQEFWIKRKYDLKKYDEKFFQPTISRFNITLAQLPPLIRYKMSINNEKIHQT